MIRSNLIYIPLITIEDSPFPYEFQLKAIPSFEKVYNGYGAYSYTGMTFNLRRKSLGQLLSGYYYPTGSFAVLSLISFLINPDQVKGILTLQCTLVEVEFYIILILDGFQEPLGIQK